LDLTENPNLEESEIPHPWEYSRFIFIKNILAPFIKKKENFILDIGSGDGFILSKLKNKNNKINFIAVDKYYELNQIEKLKKSLKTEHIYKNIESIDIGQNKISIVLLLDVLEHIEDPKKALDDLMKNSFFDKKCMFIITVPAFQFLYTAHDKNLGHFKRYDLSSIEKLIKSCGFNVFDKGYFFHSILIIRVLEKLFEVLFNYDNSNKVSKEFNNKFIKNFFTKIMILENYIFNKIKNLTGLKMPGLSSYIVCQKQQ
jgi:hypothetical protein